MFLNPPTALDVIAAAAVFGLIVALVFVLVVVMSMRRSARAQRVEDRLGLREEAPGETRVLRLWHEGREATTTVPATSWRKALPRRLEQMRRDAGWEAPVSAVILGLAGVTAFAVAVVLVVFKSPLLAAVAGLAVVLLFWLYLQQQISRRSALFERQLVDALQLAARSLRAGHPLVGSFGLIAEELDEPISTIFADICQQQQMGLSLERALQRAGAESNSTDMRLFATSVSIQLRSGGNLADMMDRLAFVIRERIRFGRRIRVLGAQSQFSKRVLLGLPFLLFFVLNAVNPKYMNTLYSTSTGKMLLALAGAGMVMGAWVMNRLTKIKW